MICPGRNDYRIPIFRHMLLFPFENKSRFTLLNAEELIDFGVNLIADFFARL